MNTIKVGHANRGFLINANVGDILVVSLPENPTTGYIWVRDDSDDVLTQTSSNFAGMEGSGIGASGTREMTFRATQPGTTTFALRLARPWEPKGTAIDRYELRMHVQASAELGVKRQSFKGSVDERD